MVSACDAKTVALCMKKDDGNGSTREEEEGKASDKMVRLQLVDRGVISKRRDC